MGLWSWLFPGPRSKLAQARALYDQGKYEEARVTVLGVPGEEAERIYREATARLKEARLAAHPPGEAGFRIEVTTLVRAHRHPYIRIVKEEIVRAGLPLDWPLLLVRATSPDEQAALSVVINQIVLRANQRLAEETGMPDARGVISLLPRST